MKTYYLFNPKNALFSLIGLLAILTTSCGSYQNSSYYDNDGVYGSQRTNTYTENKYSEQNIENSNKYAQQFKSMQDDYTYFTNVDNYNSQENDTVVTVYRNESNNNYAGWGNNSSNVTVNYYTNGWGWNNWYGNYWGWNNWYGPGWGWNNWYGNYWGWNSWYGPGWGWNNWYGNYWGWNSWYGAGWGWNGYYGPNLGWNGYYGRDVVYNNGRRGGSRYVSPSSGRIGNYSTRRTDTPRPNFSNTRNNTRTESTRTRNQVTPRDTNTSTPRNNNYTSPRSNSSSPRSNSSTPRSNNYSSPRSSGGSFGGSSGGGGGRSGGGSRGGRG